MISGEIYYLNEQVHPVVSDRWVSQDDRVFVIWYSADAVYF